MNILITNDDGIYARGLYELAKRMTAFGKVTVVAPDKEQSAIGHAITLHQPLRCSKIKLYDLDIDAWWVNGTPADCVKLGIETLLSEAPDLIISGINDGENLGTDIIYSGTVSAAIEGSMFSIPSIAISYAKHCSMDFSIPAEASLQVIRQVLNHFGKTKILLNVNIPEADSIEALRGIKIARLGVKKYRNSFEERKDPRGNSYYWLAGELVRDETDEDTDIYAIRKGYIAVTPIHVDLTDYTEIKRIGEWSFDKVKLK
ncbi:MAG: 5'/3'-nucleotidase SurE [Clostridiaceae bacterium]|nr:5'/3'-nucleotidase SurE [Clostridiaceae bacterium]